MFGLGASSPNPACPTSPLFTPTMHALPPSIHYIPSVMTKPHVPQLHFLNFAAECLMPSVSSSGSRPSSSMYYPFPKRNERGCALGSDPSPHRAQSGRSSKSFPLQLPIYSSTPPLKPDLVLYLLTRQPSGYLLSTQLSWICRRNGLFEVRETHSAINSILTFSLARAVPFLSQASRSRHVHCAAFIPPAEHPSNPEKHDRP